MTSFLQKGLLNIVRNHRTHSLSRFPFCLLHNHVHLEQFKHEHRQEKCLCAFCRTHCNQLTQFHFLFVVNLIYSLTPPHLFACSERSSTRVKAPPGGKSSIFFGEYEAETQNSSRNNKYTAKATSSNDFYGDANNNNNNSTSQETSNRRPHHHPANADIFGNSETTSVDTSPRRGSQQPKQTLDVFGADTTEHQQHSSRRTIPSHENLDIYGRRTIQQPNSHIFEGGDVIDYTQGQNRSQSSQQNRGDTNHAPAGGNVRQSNSSSGIFDPSSQRSDEHTASHRRIGGAVSSTDVFGNRQNDYCEATDYQTSSSSFRKQLGRME